MQSISRLTKEAENGIRHPSILTEDATEAVLLTWGFPTKFRVLYKEEESWQH